MPPGPEQPVSGFVLAGGRSLRLGQDKTRLPWKRTTLLEHAVSQLRAACGTVAVCTARNDLPHGLVAIPDARSGCGPLGGMVAALEQSSTDWNFFLAVDLPLVPIPVLQWLARRAQTTRLQVRALIPEIDGIPQPLCALLHRDLAPGLRDALESGTYKLMRAIQEAGQPVSGGGICGIPLDELAAANPRSPVPPADWFLNVNTPMEWERALELGRQESPEERESF